VGGGGGRKQDCGQCGWFGSAFDGLNETHHKNSI